MKPKIRSASSPFLQVLSDAEGSVSVGWVGEGVLYARLEGVFSASLGTAYASRLETLVNQAQGVHYFADASGMTEYDLLARSAFVRVVLANRRKFLSLVLLPWAGGLARVTSAFLETFGDGTYIAAERTDFNARLSRAAPLALQKIGSTWDTTRAHR